MSQHIYRTRLPDGKPVTVLMGWDRPLAMLFLVVEQNPASDDYLYSNLDDQRSIGQPLSYFLDRLEGPGIQIPTRMAEEVRADQRLNVGNRRVCWDAE